MDSVPPKALADFFWPDGLEVPRFIIDTARKSSFYPVKPGPLYSHIDFIYCKGPAEDLKGEMSKLISGSVDYDLAPLERVMMNWMRDRVPVKFPPIPMIDVVKGKDLKSSVGMPWKFYFADYGCMVTEFGYEEIARMVEELEESIIQGQPYTTLFYLFSKLDKYTSSKINKRGFRSIQVADVFLLFIMQKYFAQMVKELEMAAIQMFLVTDVDSYAMRMQSHRNRHSFGVDFSAYDKTESSDLMRMSFRLLCSRVVIPPQVASFIEEAICCPVYILPVEGTPIYGSGGSNPSGQFLTSVLFPF